MLKRIVLAAVCSLSLAACDTGRVTEPATESIPLFVSGSTEGVNNTIPLSGVIPAAMNPCGAGAGDVSYSGSVRITGTLTKVGQNLKVEGELDASTLNATMGVASYAVQPNPITFKNTFTANTSTHTENVSATLVSQGAASYSVTVTLGVTISSAGEITHVAATNISCTAAR